MISGEFFFLLVMGIIVVSIYIFVIIPTLWIEYKERRTSKQNGTGGKK